MLDVKVGSGAFMRRREDAQALARTLVSLASELGCRTVAWLTSMDAPLGRAVGNALELLEAVEVLRGAGPADVRALTLRLGGEMLVLGGAVPRGRPRARSGCSGPSPTARGSNASGRWSSARVGMRGRSMIPVVLLGRLESRDVAGPVPRAGSSGIDTEALGLAAVVLGAGRLRADAAIDAGVGFTVLRTLGDAVASGEPLLRIHHRPGTDVGEVVERVQRAYRIGTDRRAQAAALPRANGGSTVTDLLAQLDEAAAAVRAQAPGFVADVGLVLGSGLSGAVRLLDAPLDAAPRRRCPTSAPRPSPDIRGAWCFGHAWADSEWRSLAGRLHPYEGWTAEETVFPVRLLLHLGAPVLVLTNAAGGVRADLGRGDWMAVRDHLNLSGLNPLRGPNDVRLGPRFPDLSRAYDPGLRALLAGAAVEAGVGLAEGVYAMMAGPSYETPAEIQMLRTLGADAVGMSTVLEVIAAVHMGARVGVPELHHQQRGRARAGHPLARRGGSRGPGSRGGRGASAPRLSPPPRGGS